jgi:hypothetical protein
MDTELTFYNIELLTIYFFVLFEDNWALKSLLSSVIIEIVFILLTFRLEDSRNITENSEGLTICV